jgi:hypothetical protein
MAPSLPDDSDESAYDSRAPPQRKKASAKTKAPKKKVGPALRLLSFAPLSAAGVRTSLKTLRLIPSLPLLALRDTPRGSISLSCRPSA